MGNLNINLFGYTLEIINTMISGGYVKSKTEAIRLALFEFNKKNKLVSKDENKELDTISLEASIQSMKEYFNDPKEDKAWNKYL